MWSLTLARAGRASGAEKFSSPARKTFFDSIGQFLPPSFVAVTAVAPQ
jgi:hypothetical protein